MWLKQIAIILFLAFLAEATQAATVTGINKKKALIKIDEGTPGGFVKKAKVCFFNDANKKIGCGAVAKSTESYALIKIKSPKLILKIKKGMTANLVGGSADSGELLVASDGPDHRNNIKLGYIFTALAPATFNRITYNPPSATEAITPQASLWKKEQVASSSLLGAYGEGEFGIGATMAMSIGLRYRNYSGFEASTDYSQDFTEYVNVTQSGTALGLYSDFTYLDVSFTQSLFFRMYSGLDIDMSTVIFKAVQQSDAGANNEIANYKSTMNLVSLRLGSSLSFMIGPLGMITPGVNLLVPVFAAGGSTSATVNDPQADTLLIGGKGAAEDDLKKSIDHKKASFGAEVYLAAFIAF